MIDERDWPLLVVRWPAGALDDVTVAVAVDRLRGIAARDEAHVVLLEARDARAPSRAQLGMLLDLATFAALRSRCVAMAVVTRSPVVRATVDSIRWMALMSPRWETFDDEHSASRWLDAQLGRA